MKTTRKLLCLLLAATMALASLAVAAEEAEALPEGLELQPGDALHGFTVTEVYDSSLLSSTIYTFTHDVSDATLVYVKNDDPELAFSIGFHTPYVDETDTNHVFEHAILAGSEKYPSKDVFFDVANRTYSTFANASTGMTTTNYPVASMSEEQLLKMVDVYMSCMVAPLVLEDENIFKREAVRFELDDPEGDIAVNGTVFAEDTGYMTSQGFRSLDHIMDALYPGQTASNMIGMAYEHYGDLTWEHTVETYERCYHFDNSLIFLYGDLDLDRFLSFLDGDYLSKYPAQGTDLSAWEDAPAAPGYVDVRREIPAYEGDVVERNCIISYAVDLEGATDAQLSEYGILSTLLNQVGSPMYNLKLERGIENNVSAGMVTNSAKPFFMFSMDYANPDQKGELKALAEDALAQVASEGIDPAMLEMVIKAQERSSKLLRNSTNVGVNLSDAFLGQWASSSDPNFYRVTEQALRAMHADGQQQILRRMALDLLTPRRSALVTSVPAPGLAEAHDAALADYLADMKAAMTPEELEAMVAETAAFNEWNAEEQRNNDFLISPRELPEPAEYAWTKEVVDGVTVYRGETELSGVGQYAVYFDLSGMSREEMEYLMLSDTYRLQMDTTQHDAAELYRLFGEYVSDLNSELVYPGEAAGENHRPMLCVSWTSLAEDFETSLGLILELCTQTDFSDTEMLSYLTAVYAENWDMSRQDANDIAYDYAHSGVGPRGDSFTFDMDVDGQDCYALISDAAQRLYTEEGFAEALAARYESAVRKAFTRDNLIFMSVAGETENDAIIPKAVETLNALPEKEGADAVYELPEAQKSLAICVESSLNTGYLIGDFMQDAEFTGKYIPFLYALSDNYTVPVFRFQMGAYSASSYHQWGQGCLVTMVYSDPNVRATVEALDAMPLALADIQLTDEALDGYILKAYSNATGPQGMLSGVMADMQFDLLGADAERIKDVKLQIREATLEDQAEAAARIGAVMADSNYCVDGNEALIRADADCFDQVVSWRHGDAADEAPAAEAFAYAHDPRENPEAMKDVVENPDAVYGFSPNPESVRLGEYAEAIDWTDPAQVAEARATRQAYFDSMSELYRMIEDMLLEAKPVEEIARAVSQRRNELRLEAYKDDPEGLEVVKKSNLETYGDEMGPTADSLYEKYGSWQTVLEKALSTNIGMDVCLGFYDDYYDFYDLESVS